MSHSRLATAGGSVRTHALPPKGFNPRTASARELRRYGLPQRPDPAIHPKLAARWDEIFSRKITYITPTFRPLEELLPGIKRRGRPRRDLQTVTNPTWSGAVVHATGSQTFTWVLGQWNVPDLAPAAGGGGQYTFAFIGIDGNTDVTQIGTIQSVSTAANGSVSKSCYA
ncbi:MAG TPA: G1 family glutamic endopeptidase, partial [Roseiarcus sp.]